ncbi:MAG: hypothetical protein M3O22_00650 [Pseudomonadota bacterium]|nr:hypothetical protein [Pseudomonadota bacterium]
MSTTVHLFDLDQTLTDEGCHQPLVEAFGRNVPAFISRFLGISREQAIKENTALYRKHGSTLYGLQAEHPDRFDPEEYFKAAFGGIDYSTVRKNEALIRAFRIRQEREPDLVNVIFTNSAGFYAHEMTRAIGIHEFFSHFLDPLSVGLIPKTNPAAFVRACRHLDVPPYRARMHEDLTANARAAHEAGLETVLVLPGHKDISLILLLDVDYVTCDLADFLANPPRTVSRNHLRVWNPAGPRA